MRLLNTYLIRLNSLILYATKVNDASVTHMPELSHLQHSILAVSRRINRNQLNLNCVRQFALAGSGDRNFGSQVFTDSPDGGASPQPLEIFPAFCPNVSKRNGR